MRYDNETEYTDKKFIHLCEENGIQRHFSVRKTPQHNGVAERMNMTLTKKARCLRLNIGLSKGLWATTLNMECYLFNRSPRTSLDRKVTEEVWTCNPIDMTNLRILGVQHKCVFLVKISLNLTQSQKMHLSAAKKILGMEIHSDI